MASRAEPPSGDGGIDDNTADGGHVVAAVGSGDRRSFFNDDTPSFPATPFGSPLHIARAKGARLYEKDGRALLDAGGQAGVNNVGYGREEVVAVAMATMGNIGHLSPTLACDERLALIATLRDKWLPAELSRLQFVNSGSEAAEFAIRLARQHFVQRGLSSKWKIVGRRPGYHGTTLGALSVTGNQMRRTDFEPYLFRAPFIPAHGPGPGDYCAPQPESDLSSAEALARVVDEEGAHTVAAFIAEPVIASSTGASAPPPGYWPRIEEICRENDILIICDEVVSGFGRTGPRMGSAHGPVTPDIMTFAKGLSGGYAPLGGVAASEEVYDPLARRRRSIMPHTMGGHPLACAVANEVLSIIERECLLDRIPKISAHMRTRLAPLYDHPAVAAVRGVGLLWAVEFEPDAFEKPAAAPDRLSMRIVSEAARRGVLFWPGGSSDEHDLICLAPPFITSETEVDQMASVLAACIDDLCLSS